MTLRLKIRDEGLVRNKAVCLAIGISCNGDKEVLGLWIEQTEGAKFWLRVMNELKARGTGDLLIAVVDGLKGFPEAITTVFPDCVAQTCLVHLIRYSLQFASWKERKGLAKAIRAIYSAASAEAAAAELDRFEPGPNGQRYAAAVHSWRRRWEEVIPFFAFSPEVRKIIYTTNAIESLHQPSSQGDSEQGAFRQRRGGDEANLPGTAEYHGEVEQRPPRMACCQAAVRDPVRRPVCADGLDDERRLSPQDFIQDPIRPPATSTRSRFPS